MRRLPLVLLALAAPGFAQEADAGVEVPDGGSAVLELPAAVDAGVTEPVASPEAPVDRVGRHFAFTWDSVGPRPGDADVQLWMTPRWGRLDGFFGFDVRGGVLVGLPRDWAAGVFIDAAISSVGVNQDSGIDARLTLHLQTRSRVQDWFSYGVQAELGGGEKALTVALLVAADRDFGPVRIAANLDGFTQTEWSRGAAQAFTTARTRQTLAFSYALTNGVSVGLELQNRLSWLRGGYAGDAFLIGPSVTYRGSRLWWSVSMLPQVAAVKPAERIGVGDPLELTDNERFTLRLSAGIIAR